MSRRAALVAAALAVLAPAAASAHEVLHEVERGRAIAVKAWFADGEVLAYVQYELYSPADPRIPYQKGRTDRSGWLSFVPDVPGKWRVKIVDDSGHGVDLEVDATAAPATSPPPALPPPGSSYGAFALRPLVGVVIIAAVFGLLFTLYRRKGTRP